MHSLKELDFEEAEDEPGRWACGWVVHANLDDHARKCPLELVKCSDGQSVARRDVAAHEAEVARWRKEQKEQEKHEYVTCNDGVKVPKWDVERYLREDCMWTEMRCSFGCGHTLRRKDIPHHQEYLCPKRVVQCRLGCGVAELWADEQAVHEQEHCLWRDVPCPNSCGEVVKSGDLQRHMDGLCAHRLVECECCMFVPFSKYRDHRIMECPEERVQCRLGCGEKVRRADLDFFETYTSRRRQVWCAIGCGALVFFDEQQLHCNAICPKRPVTCVVDPFSARGGCGEVMRAEEVADHDMTCPYRQITIHQSARQLRSWADGKRLVMCDQTGENILTWAADRNESTMAGHVISITPDADLDHETFAGETALTKACKRGHWDMVWLLLKRGAGINFETKRGRTALSEAACADQVGVAHLLLREKADFQHVDKRGKSAVQWARMSRSMRVVKVLEAALLLEKERNELCVAIACHDHDEVVRIVGDGEEYRFNHHKVLEEEAQEVDDMLAGLKNDADSLQRILIPLTPKVLKLQHDLKAKEDAAHARITEADRLAKHCEDRTKEQQSALKAAMLAIEHVSQGDIIDVLELKWPPRKIERILQCICILQSRAPVAVKDPSKNSGVVMSWWKSAHALLREKVLLHQLRFINKANLPKDKLANIRAIMQETSEGGFDYYVRRNALARARTHTHTPISKDIEGVGGGGICVFAYEHGHGHTALTAHAPVHIPARPRAKKKKTTTRPGRTGTRWWRRSACM